MADIARKVAMEPAPVARICVKAMLKGKAEVVPGLLNRITAFYQQVLPAGPVERIGSGIYLKRLGK